MALEMKRHPCGIIYTKDFAHYLRQKEREEFSRHPGELLSLEYVRCAEGEKAGASWWYLDWVSHMVAPMQQQYRIENTPVFIHRQTKSGLKNRLLHFVDGQVVVKS